MSFLRHIVTTWSGVAIGMAVILSETAPEAALLAVFGLAVNLCAAFWPQTTKRPS